MKKVFLSAFLVIMAMLGYSQEYKENVAEASKIKNDTAYFWYQGGSDFETIEDAQEQAEIGLLSKIKNEWKSHIVYAGGDFNAQKEMVFSTFEHFIKQERQYLILKEGSENQCFAYLDKNVFRTACEKRKAEINSYLDMGNLTYEKENFGDALRYYYIALMLCYSHPDGDNLRFYDEELNKQVKTVQWLTNRIDGDDGILASVRFIVKDWKKEENRNIVTLYVSMTNDATLSNINIRYNNGKFNETANVNNGLAQLEIYGGNDGEPLKSVNAEVDLYYKDIEKESPAAFAMMKSLRKRLIFGKTGKTIVNRTNEKKVGINSRTNGIDKGVEAYKVTDNDFINKMKQIEKAVRNNDFESVGNLFSDEGYVMFLKLKNYGKTSVVGTPEYKMFRYNDEVICRSIPMRFSFNSESFTHDVVFRFDESSKLVTSIAFRLTETAENDIWNNKWSVDSRIVLTNFLEDYQTAYALKQLEYLNKIFSDDALIIVGHVVEYKPISQDGVLYSNNRKVESIKKNKAEYMADLEKQFNNKKYINIHFTNLEVKQASGKDEDVYGVQVRQYYNSSNYNDDGYLFLMVDLREELPVIHVRTWQPGKTDINDLITLRDLL